VTLASGNAAYLYLGLGFIQMLKAFTPASVVLVLKICGMPLPSRTALWGVALIVGGTMVEVKGEMHLTVMGLALMFTSEFMEATNLVLTQRLLQNLKFSVVEGLYVLAPPGTLCLALMAAFLEWPHMWQNGNHRIILDHPLMFLAAGVLGLAVNFLGMVVVQATSSLTLKILNLARCIAMVIMGVTFYGEECTLQEFIGYAIALTGFAGYNWAQMAPEAAERCERSFRQRCCCCDCTACIPSMTSSSGSHTSKGDTDDEESCSSTTPGR